MRRYFSEDIDEPTLYDAVLNMGANPIETVARHVIQLVAERMRNVEAARAPAAGSI